MGVGQQKWFYVLVRTRRPLTDVTATRGWYSLRGTRRFSRRENLCSEYDLVPARARALADHAHSVVQRHLREYQPLVAVMLRSFRECCSKYIVFITLWSYMTLQP